MRRLLLTASLGLLACRPPAQPVTPEPPAEGPQTRAGERGPLAIVEAEPEPAALAPEPPPPDDELAPPEPEPEPAWTSAGGGGTAGAAPSSSVKPTLAGALSATQIRNVVRSHLPNVKLCYERGLAKDPKLAGRISITYVIGPEGKVIEAKVTASDLADKDVAVCVQKELETWVFPKPRGGGVVRVSYPFVFKSD